jgi:malate synthase
VWQWIRNATRLADGRTVTASMVREVLAEELGLMTAAMSPAERESSRVAAAAQLFESVALGSTLPSFLTREAYAQYLV